jgi:hypothetical protein
MKQVLICVLIGTALTGCASPPKPPQPTGEWIPVNQPAGQQVSRTASQ